MKRCVLCVSAGEFEDEVSGTLFCRAHAGALAMSDHDVNVYSMALRLHGYYDTSCPLPSLALRGVS